MFKLQALVKFFIGGLGEHIWEGSRLTPGSVLKDFLVEFRGLYGVPDIAPWSVIFKQVVYLLHYPLVPSTGLVLMQLILI